MDLPHGYELRAPTPEDLQEVTALLRVDDPDKATLGVDFVEGGWSQRGFELATDAWAVDDPAGVVIAMARSPRTSRT
jgi:hypothetical protein